MDFGVEWSQIFVTLLGQEKRLIDRQRRSGVGSDIGVDQ